MGTKPSKPRRAPPRSPRGGDSPTSGHGYCTQYVHYRTKKLMVAEEYGYCAWPFGGGRRR